MRESLDYVRDLNPEIAAIVRGAYGRSIRDGFGVVVALSACAGVASCEFFFPFSSLKQRGGSGLMTWLLLSFPEGEEDQ